MKLRSIAIVLFVLCAAAGEVSDTAPRSPAGTAAIKKYRNTRSRAEAAYKAALTVAARDERDELEAAKQAAMKAGNLDEANRCDAAKKEAIAAMDADSPVASASADFVGFTYLWNDRASANAAKIQYTATGQVNCAAWHGVGSWRRVDDNTIEQKEPNQKRSIATFTSDRRAAFWQYDDGSVAWMTRQ